MKRSRNDDELINPIKNDLTITAPPPCKKKAKLVLCLFDWLPHELVEHILEEVPIQLDIVTREVCQRWRAVIGRRWNAVSRVYAISENPSVGWALQRHFFSLVHWLCSDMKIRPHPSTVIDWVTEACRAGNIKTLEWMWSEKAEKSLHIYLTDCMVRLAARHGGLICYTFILHNSDRPVPRNGDVYQACLGGQLETVKWIIARQEHARRTRARTFIAPAFYTCMLSACSGGHIEVVDWILSCSHDKTTFYGPRDLASEFVEAAITHGHLKMAQHLVRRWACPMNGKDVFARAGDNAPCDVEAFRWILDIVPAQEQASFRMVPIGFVFRRDFDVLNLLADKGMLNLEVSLFKDAIRGDDRDLDMVQWLWNHCAQCTIKEEMWNFGMGYTDVFREALFGGHLNVMEWLQEHGMGWKGTMVKVAYNHILARAARLSYEARKKGIKYLLEGKQQIDPKDCLIWMHQGGMIDVSQARVLSNGYIWFHHYCNHETDHECRDRLDHFHKFKLANTPWWEGKPTVEYLIPRC